MCLGVQAWAIASRSGFRADTIHIPYSKRVLGGLFGSNVAFTDHSVGTRLSGDYPVVTVRSILSGARKVTATSPARESQAPAFSRRSQTGEGFHCGSRSRRPA